MTTPPTCRTSENVAGRMGCEWRTTVRLRKTVRGTGHRRLRAKACTARGGPKGPLGPMAQTVVGPMAQSVVGPMAQCVGPFAGPVSLAPRWPSVLGPLAGPVSLAPRWPSVLGPIAGPLTLWIHVAFWNGPWLVVAGGAPPLSLCLGAQRLCGPSWAGSRAVAHGPV
jgi:hypothetical protein